METIKLLTQWGIKIVDKKQYKDKRVKYLNILDPKTLKPLPVIHWAEQATNRLHRNNILGVSL